MKICIKCKTEKNENFFNKTSNKCKDCEKTYNKQQYQLNKEKILKDRKEFRQDNIEIMKERDHTQKLKRKKKVKEYNKKYHKEHKEERSKYDKNWRAHHKEERSKYNKIYFQENKESKLEYQRKYIKNRTATDSFFRSRHNISTLIRKMLKSQGSSKNRKSHIKYLTFTKEEYIQHMEKYFNLPGNEWMNWENQGQFRVKYWDDNDPKTWKWQLDHIIPHSTLPYTSMEDENFKKCWALENLRPLSAKQNQLDGASKIRHKVNKT